MWLRGVQPGELVQRCLAGVPVPVGFEQPEGDISDERA
jgi:hypothetical protein